MEPITISDAKLEFNAEGGAVIEASDLGLAPGDWPCHIDVVSTAMPDCTTQYILSTWLADGAHYRTRDGLAYINLLND